MNRSQRRLAAACLARTNYGLAPKEANDLRWIWKRAQERDEKHPIDLTEAVEHVCGDVIENDEMMDMFLDEARMWSEKISVLRQPQILSEYPSLRKTLGSLVEEVRRGGDRED